MKYFRTVLVVLSLLCAAGSLHAQSTFVSNVPQAADPLSKDSSDDVFVPISKYMAAGNADALSAWFADNLEIGILSSDIDASRSQARQILKTFFDNYAPRSFNIDHTTGRAGMKYALGTLRAGGASFSVTIFLSFKDEAYQIRQLKIEKL